MNPIIQINRLGISLNLYRNRMILKAADKLEVKIIQPVYSIKHQVLEIVRIAFGDSFQQLRKGFDVRAIEETFLCFFGNFVKNPIELWTSVNLAWVDRYFKFHFPSLTQFPFSVKRVPA